MLRHAVSLMSVNSCKSGHGLQLRGHGCSIRLMSTTHFKLVRTQGHVFSDSDTPVDVTDVSEVISASIV
jgi:hypothetical protein